MVLDLESKYGTFVNGYRIQFAHLRPGDTLCLGMTRLVVEEGGRTLRIVSGGETTVSDLPRSQWRQ